MNLNILYMILLASTISAVHCRSGGGRSSGGSSSRGSSNGGRSSGGSSSGGSSKSDSWFSTGGNSRNSYKPKYTPTHSNKWPSSSSSSNSDESSYKPQYTPSLDLPSSYNYGNFNSDSSRKKDYNNFSNGYMTGKILAEIAAINRLKLNEREFDIQTETEKPLANNQIYPPFNMDINDINIFLSDAKTTISKFITVYNKPGQTLEAPSITPSSLENIRPQTQEDQTDKITDSCTEICDIFPLEMTTNKIHNEDISSTIEPSVEITVKSFYQKITSIDDLEKSTNFRSTEIRNSNKENCDSIETTTNKDNKQDSTTTIIVSETENSLKYPRFDTDFDDLKLLLADAKTIKIKSLLGYNDPQGKTENNDPFETATNRIIKKHIPTTTIDPNLDTSTKWYYRKFSTTTPLPNCRRVMNSFLNNKGEIIDSVTEVCDPPTTTTTTKPLWKMTTVKPVTTSTAKPYVTVCRPVMDSFLNENGEIIDSVKEVCTLEPVT